MYDLYEKRARDSGIDLVKEFSEYMGTAFLDPKGIHSAISNLISNAIQASASTPGDRELRISVGGRVENSILFIWVADNGMGMSEEVMQRLFTKFYSTKGSRGTGLGLVVTQKVIEEHGGNISVESTLGMGTRFHIEIPLKQPKQMKASVGV